MRMLPLLLLLAAACASSRASHQLPNGEPAPTTAADGTESNALTKYGKGLYARAAFDLSCDAEQLSFHLLTKRTVGVSGCGQRATYVLVDRKNANGYVESREWIMNDAAKN